MSIFFYTQKHKKTKQMEKQLTNRDKIILVVKESIKFGKLTDFYYDGMVEKHKEVGDINKFQETINNKLLLFENLDETSYVFERIFLTAKIALTKLQDEEKYNYYSAELILKINQLEECFRKKLKPLGVRVIQNEEKIIEKTFDIEKIISNQHKKVIELDENGNEVETFEYQEIEEPLTKNAIFIKSNVTGESFNKKNKEKKEIMDAIKDYSFED